MKPIGYLVMESCEEFEQALALRSVEIDGASATVLTWTDARNFAALFMDRMEAKRAIRRTERYRLALVSLGLDSVNVPTGSFCKVVPVAAAGRASACD